MVRALVEHSESHDAIDILGGWMGVLSYVMLWMVGNLLLFAGSGRPDGFSFVTFNFVITPLLAILLLGFISIVLMRAARRGRWRDAVAAVIRAAVMAGVFFSIASGKVTYLFMWLSPAK